ncbi:hypothetical protein ACFOZ1_06660 [Gracilibacillus marinus]|uniref:YopX protein domain-containing protein n=1 Tax=Gracilibacillus marinus TaxID=630535 RepID=A0ABV8VXI1_9BACI
MEHPAVYHTRKFGNPIKESKLYGTDHKGNEVFVDDEIYIYEDEFWLVETLSTDEKELLEFFGATKVIAKSEF